MVETRDADFRLLRDELFGPIVTAYVYDEKRWDDTLDLVDRTAPYALTGAIFADDRAAVETRPRIALRYTAGNFYVNDKPTGAVVGQQPFGGARASGTNDKAGSLLDLIRWVKPAHDQGGRSCRRPTTATRSSAPTTGSRRPTRAADADDRPAQGQSHGRRVVRALATLLFTGLCTAYILWQIDFADTATSSVTPTWLLLRRVAMGRRASPDGLALAAASRRRGIEDRLTGSLRAYFVSFTAGQVLPTSIGGDAARIYETAQAPPGHGGSIAGSVLLERGARRRGDADARRDRLRARRRPLRRRRLSLGRARLRRRATVVAGFALFSRRSPPPARAGSAASPRVRLDRPLARRLRGAARLPRARRLIVGVFALTLGVQAVRVLAIWLAGKAVGVDLSPRPYYVMGPLLFLVMLVPFTINGLAVREAFFVSFLGQLGVAPTARSRPASSSSSLDRARGARRADLGPRGARAPAQAGRRSRNTSVGLRRRSARLSGAGARSTSRAESGGRSSRPTSSSASCVRSSASRPASAAGRCTRPRIGSSQS